MKNKEYIGSFLREIQLEDFKIAHKINNGTKLKKKIPNKQHVVELASKIILNNAFKNNSSIVKNLHGDTHLEKLLHCMFNEVLHNSNIISRHELLNKGIALDSKLKQSVSFLRRTGRQSLYLGSITLNNVFVKLLFSAILAWKISSFYDRILSKVKNNYIPKVSNWVVNKTSTKMIRVGSQLVTATEHLLHYSFYAALLSIFTNSPIIRAVALPYTIHSKILDLDEQIGWKILCRTFNFTYSSTSDIALKAKQKVHFLNLFGIHEDLKRIEKVWIAQVKASIGTIEREVPKKK